MVKNVLSHWIQVSWDVAPFELNGQYQLFRTHWWLTCVELFTAELLGPWIPRFSVFFIASISSVSRDTQFAIGRRIISKSMLSWEKREAVGSEVHSWSQVFQDVFLESWRENRSEGLRPCTTSSRQNKHLDFTRSLDIHHLFSANYSHTAQDLLLTPKWS